MTSASTGAPGARIEIRGLTKDFGDVKAVDNLSFDVEPGRITGFLGPNGAGKTTTLRMALGLVRPTSGTATIGGSGLRPYPSTPARCRGPALEATGFHPGRSGRDHLRVLADTNDIPDAAPSTSCWPWLDWRTQPASGPAATRWVCGSASAWPPR